VRILICAGEVSGDTAGARLAREIRAKSPQAILFGVGGPRMKAAGVDLLADTNPAGTVGISEALRAVPTLTRAASELWSRVKRDRPDAAVLIGNDVFNMLVGRHLRRMAVPVAWWFPPQVWVWRAVAGLFARSVDAMFTVFPDESAVYGRARPQLDVTFVGHYLADELRSRTSEDLLAARRSIGLSPERPVVGLLPGSRGHELEYMLDVFLDAAVTLSTLPSAPCFVLPLSDDARRARVEASLAARPGLEVRLVSDGPAAIRASDVILVSSGTATLEATLLTVPMVVAYRVSWLTNTVINTCVGLGLIASRTVALPNLLLGSRIVPELLQEELSAARLADEARRLLEDKSAAARMNADLATVAARVRGGQSAAHVAALVLAQAAHRDVSLAEAV
jgi:lipid-A-disaccharide synthase